ncbi:hypothetical protein GYMLUDRAFT_46611 [Collybiopsis luxurians FD-317 M1]|uniref:Major facilitator superfamily (MFS) profile domain-containing protein n=1 Tax=Collybiopsis luxurians FD-317 M1 TaxID=944289 RepID=A0A0D0BPN2_9AGAR|nr:hypothetical protein GYMLUDRAFT_46611 [Collybiopsis luxurians FD-317 M1]
MPASHPGSPRMLDECTPLLDEVHKDPEGRARYIKPATPLPKLQLAIICVIRFTDSLLSTQMWPYINQFILSLRLTKEPSQAGFYSGLLDSVFGLTQLLTTYYWSRLSNRVGRKPVILVGTIGVALSTMYLGISTSLAELLISRIIGGVFGGTASVVPSVVGDLSDDSNQAVVFPIYALAWPIGSIAGPFIGAMLSNPARKYGSVFQNSIFSRHPYFLPGLASGLLTLLCTLLAYLYLKESFRKRPAEDISDEVFSGECDTSLKQLFSIPIIWSLTISAFSFNVNAYAFDFIFLLLCYSPIERGGLSLSSSAIGLALSACGVVYLALQLFIMPVMLKRVEATALYTITIASWPVVFATLPLINIVARRGFATETGEMDSSMRIILWAGVAFVLILSRIGYEAYSLSLILTKTNTSDPALLAVSNGLVSCANSLARIVGPVLGSFIFSVSDQYHLLGGYFWAMFMVCSCLWTCKLSRDVARHSRSSLKYYTEGEF